MSKGITKESIVNVTLELIKDKENIRSVNLREIARVLGCAHTNIYNYFSDIDQIFWEALEEILDRSVDFISGRIGEIQNPSEQLEKFYEGFIHFYIQNRGWYTLFWVEKLHGEAPEKSINKVRDTVNKYNLILGDIFNLLYQVELTSKEIMKIFHTVHCYLYGEISIFLSGRGLISAEEEFRKDVLRECIKLNKLLIENNKLNNEPTAYV